jgi:lipoate-protein ligase A
MRALRRAEHSGEEALLVWEAEQVCAVLPRGGREEAHLLPGAGAAALRRESGGGAVLVGPGCLNYAVALSLEGRPELIDVERSYAVLLGGLLGGLGLTDGRAVGSDLVMGDRKFAGHAQRRTRNAMLHHGTILYGFDLRLIGRNLREPARQPAYRQGRTHAEFLVNAPVGHEALLTGLRAFAAGLSIFKLNLASNPGIFSSRGATANRATRS